MTRAKSPARTVRCAIYTRKSTEEGLDRDFNSLDAQRESGEAFIKSQTHEGWQCLPERYDDGGFTGGNMERPALRQLMAQIAAGAIDCVVVYKVDRLSRSLLDFARMMEVFERHGVAFVSVTQQFNTASSMGRLILNVLLSFAQFEREMISERTRDKIAAARRKGKWSGGRAPLGYDVVDRKLVVNQEEAEQVRRIFSLYQSHRSLLAVVRQLEHSKTIGKAWTTRKGKHYGGRPFTKTSLHQLLTNVMYTGKVRHKKEVFAGEHAAIIDPQLFAEVQAILHGNGRESGRQPRKQAALLAGLLTCAACDRAMSPSYATRGSYRYRYYVCTGAQKRGWGNCRSPSVPANQIERFVVDELRSIGADPESVAGALSAWQPDSDESAEGRLNVDQMLAGLGHVGRVWESLEADAQTDYLQQVLQRVAFDAKLGQIAITFRPEGIRQLANRAHELAEDVCNPN